MWLNECAYLFAGGWAAAKEAARWDQCYHQSAGDTQHKVSCESHTHTKTLVMLTTSNKASFNELNCLCLDILNTTVGYVLIWFVSLLFTVPVYVSVLFNSIKCSLFTIISSCMLVLSACLQYVHACVCCSCTLYSIPVLLPFCLTFSLCMCMFWVLDTSEYWAWRALHLYSVSGGKEGHSRATCQGELDFTRWNTTMLWNIQWIN